MPKKWHSGMAYNKVYLNQFEAPFFKVWEWWCFEDVVKEVKSKYPQLNDVHITPVTVGRIAKMRGLSKKEKNVTFYHCSIVDDVARYYLKKGKKDV